MNRATIAKISEISTGIGLILAGIMVYVLGLINFTKAEINIFLVFLFFFIALFATEMGFFWIRRYYLMRDVLKTRPPERLIARAASAAVPILFGISIIRIIFAGAGFVIAFYLIIKYLSSSWRSVDFYGSIYYLAAIPLYLVLRILLADKIKSYFTKMSKALMGDYPRVRIDGKYLILNLGKGYLEKYRELKIPLDEIEDIKILDRYQGIALVKYVLGPDVEFGVRSVADKIAYQQGKMERPIFFSYLENVTGAKTLYLAGPNLLYLVGVQDDTELRQLIKNK